MHRILCIPIIAHSSLQPLPGRTFVKLGTLIASPDILGGYEIDIIDRVCFNNRDRYIFDSPFVVDIGDNTNTKSV